MADREELERSFLSAALHDNSVLSATQLTAEMFTTYREVFVRLSAMAERAPVNKGMLLRQVSAHERDLVAGLEPWTSATWESAQRGILKAWGLSVLHSAAKTALTQDYDQALETFEKAGTAVGAGEVGSKTKRLKDLLLPTLERIQKGAEFVGVPWGLPSIDRATLGAKAGQLVVIAARPSQGKSALMAQLIRNMAPKAKVGVVTIESDEIELTMRMLAGVSKVDSRLLASGMAVKSHPKALAMGGQELLETMGENVLIHDRSGIRLRQLQTVARRMAAEGIRVCSVDYLQLVRIPGKDTKREEVAEVSTALKGIARELKICVVALAQLSREADDKRPTMGDCQHSSQIEQDADQVWLIWNKRDKQTGSWTESRIILDKVRDGQTADVPVFFQRELLSFHELAKGES